MASKLQDLKAALAARGLAPKKIFGQNFMVDSNFASAIARDAALDAGTLAIEIGPGTGCLTEALLTSHPAARIVAVEIDRGLAALLRDTFAEPLVSGRLTLIEGDALNGKHGLSPDLVAVTGAVCASENRPRRVLCANLPYNAATPLLANLAAGQCGLEVDAALVTVQLELAERFFARPGESAFGALTAFLALRAEGKIARKVGGEVFWPRPGVDSAVIELRFKPWGRPDGLERQEALPFQQFLQRLFSARRKTLRGTLKPQILPDLPGVSENARAEDLRPDQLLAIFRALKS